MVTAELVERTILKAMENANLSRSPQQQLRVAPDAWIFGDGSSLDSLGLVALLMDVEESLSDIGVEVALSDERAVSQRHSPFRTVATLTSYIVSACAEA